jgi:hypothetical protein
LGVLKKSVYSVMNVLGGYEKPIHAIMEFIPTKGNNGFKA